MKIDPNSAVDLQAAYVLCEHDAIRLHDDRVVPRARLSDADNAFQELCRELDPNRYFIIALIPDDADRPVFFEAREIARAHGRHMQAPVETPEGQYRLWETYRRARETPDVDDEPI